MQGCGRQRRPPIGFARFHKSPMQVTQEDGGKLNAFANEPRMVVMERGEVIARGPGSEMKEKNIQQLVAI